MRIRTGKTLIVAPHADDEVLGCHSFLGPDCHVLYLGIEDRPSTRERLEEVRRSAVKSGFRWDALDHPVNRYSVSVLIPDLERCIAEIRPATALIAQPSYNQDHRAAYDAALVALRPHDRNWFVPNVLVYEQPDSVLWKHGAEAQPNWFRPVSIEDKLHSYSLYASQVRGHRSPDLVRALARLRGAQAGMEYAEGFTVLRLAEGG